jgi:deoxyribodipyrimidine photo-lyase
LAEALAAAGSPLWIATGRPEQLVPAFARAVRAESVVVSRDYAPYGLERDRRVAAALSDAGMSLHSRRGQLIHEPEDVRTGSGAPFRAFSPFLRRWSSLPMRPPLSAPDRLEAPDGVIRDDRFARGDVPRAADLGLAGPTASPERLLEPGEAAARRRIGAWLAAGPDRGPFGYARTRDQLADEHATSRLSQDLRFGLLSPIEVATRVFAIADGGDGAHRFVSELAWRDFYAHLLWHEPRTARGPFDRRYATLELPATDPELVDAWRTGQTGYPVVDAAMRQLLEAGFMPNRARMLVASFLTKDLLVDWRVGEAHFMRHLVDGDPASNLGGWQWAASVGTDAQPYFRVFNPVLQGERFDPDGAYVRRWVPELGHVPAARVHAPWRMSEGEQDAAGCRIGRDYPSPIVDHAEARRRAIELFGGRPRGAG